LTHPLVATDCRCFDTLRTELLIVSALGDLAHLAANEPAKHKLHGFGTHPQQQSTT
jgi:hypothetical protein